MLHVILELEFLKPHDSGDWKFKASIPGPWLGDCCGPQPAKGLGCFQSQRHNGSGGKKRIRPTYIGLAKKFIYFFPYDDSSRA